MTVSVRPARADEIAALHGGVVSSYRAWAVDVDGELGGIIGLALTRPKHQFFSSVRDNLRPHLKSMPVLRLIKQVHSSIEARGVPVLAIRDPDEATAPALLERLGFSPLTEIDGNDVYQWGYE